MCVYTSALFFPAFVCVCVCKHRTASTCSVERRAISPKDHVTIFWSARVMIHDLTLHLSTSVSLSVKITFQSYLWSCLFGFVQQICGISSTCPGCCFPEISKFPKTQLFPKQSLPFFFPAPIRPHPPFWLLCSIFKIGQTSEMQSVSN